MAFIAIAVVVLLLLPGMAAGPAYAEPPALTYECSPAPTDCTGWYRQSVTVKWGWFTGSAVYHDGDCVPNPDPWVTFSADTRAHETWCEVKDADSADRTRRGVILHIDKTAPAVAAVTARPPDYGAWFNHPVSVAFQGSDGTSGVASCSSSTYGGPDGVGIVIPGSCQDVAGNVGAGTLALNYDATPPPRPSVSALPGRRRVRVTWTTSAGSTSEVVRFARRRAARIIYQGTGDGVTDRRLRNGRRYRYVVTQIDQAGNRAAAGASAVPTTSPLLLPSAGARLKLAGPLPRLVWKSIRGARYYNVQVFRGGRKVLSAWPHRPRRSLERRWTYGSRRFKLTKGRYCWHVWPGYGPRSQRNYGTRLGTSCFRVVR